MDLLPPSGVVSPLTQVVYIYSSGGSLVSYKQSVASCVDPFSRYTSMECLDATPTYLGLRTLSFLFAPLIYFFLSILYLVGSGEIPVPNYPASTLHTAHDCSLKICFEQGYIGHMSFWLRPFFIFNR